MKRLPLPGVWASRVSWAASIALLTFIAIDCYERALQILDSYDNVTYFDGQCGAIYKQQPPMVNASRRPSRRIIIAVGTAKAATASHWMAWGRVAIDLSVARK